ncbi:MAG: histidinol dehydrogenase [Candidatus Kerfeldbacteria bacterium]|nr:histidinol dehydrogenase [Candidatus Kerfeldbacteria bacterium]
MKIINLTQLTPADYKALCQRPTLETKTLYSKVQAIIDDVKLRGDNAVRDYTKQFDGVALEDCTVSQAEFEQASTTVSVETQQALTIASANITAFHQAQAKPTLQVETMPGIVCSRQARAIATVGLYIPGGTAPLVSTVLMLAIPARLAGCREIILCSPPDATGHINPNILYAAQLSGVTKVYKVGGTQAIAALAYGTATIPKVDKVFGPGNQYVMAAKSLVSIDPAGAANDLPAGPSEVFVVADASARPDFVAADALSQAEHGTDSQATVVCGSQSQAEQIQAEIDRQLAQLPRRDIAAAALSHSAIVIADSITSALQFANDYAPEHLILNVLKAEQYCDQIQNAGSVFLGPWSPESAGDYASGTNHTLPTNGLARSYGGVSLDSFVKYITFQTLTEQAARQLGPTVTTLAELEGLEAHKRAMLIRYQS